MHYHDFHQLTPAPLNRPGRMTPSPQAGQTSWSPERPGPGDPQLIVSQGSEGEQGYDYDELSESDWTADDFEDVTNSNDVLVIRPANRQ